MHKNCPDEEIVLHNWTRKLNDDRRTVEVTYEAGNQKKGLHIRRWLIGILLFLFITLIAVNNFIIGQFRIVHFGHNTAQDNRTELSPTVEATPISGYLVHNKGCQIPSLNPFDPAIQRFVYKEEPILCEAGTHLPLVDSNDTAIFINPKAQSHFYADSENIDCCWRSVWREDDNDNAVTYGKECYAFENSTNVNAEFVKVECTKNEKTIYKDYHAFVPRKPLVEEKCNNATTSSISSPRLNVLAIGLDSVSRLNFHRSMPETVNVLQTIGALEMLGYHKVADNTYPNLVPVLTGLSKEEFEDQCWKDQKKPFDPCPFIWKNFSTAGYRTIFAEDACKITTFNYLKPGFREQPTDYYLRPYCIAAENDIGNTHKLNANLCIGTRKTFDNLLQYSRKVATEFADDAYFAFVWQTSLTHDFLNYPQLGDLSYRDLLEYLRDHSLLNNTALIIMSDHGMRWGEFRQTYQGRIEDSLPFVFVVLPPWWKERYPVAWTNLRRNARQLTTAFDLHETLKDIMNPDGLSEESMKKRTKALSRENIPRGISWFLPIPGDRTCLTADIPEHWCMCHKSKNVSLDDSVLQVVAEFMVDELNRKLKPYPQCAQLKLKGLLDAKMWTNNEQQKDAKAPLIDYTLNLQTSPGDAIFEGLIRYRTDDDSKKLMGSIGRLTAYGKQSACVDNFNMRLYCYCL